MTDETRTGGGEKVRTTALALALLACFLGAFLFAGRAPAVDAAAPAAAVKNPFAGSSEAVTEGKALFSSKCSECHDDGGGGTGPDLTDERWLYGATDADLFETISFGRKGGMPSFASSLSKEERWKLVTYVTSLRKK